MFRGTMKSFTPSIVYSSSHFDTLFPAASHQADAFPRSINRSPLPIIALGTTL